TLQAYRAQLYLAGTDDPLLIETDGYCRMQINVRNVALWNAGVDGSGNYGIWQGSGVGTVQLYISPNDGTVVIGTNSIVQGNQTCNNIAKAQWLLATYGMTVQGPAGQNVVTSRDGVHGYGFWSQNDAQYFGPAYPGGGQSVAMSLNANALVYSGTQAYR